MVAGASADGMTRGIGDHPGDGDPLGATMTHGTGDRLGHGARHGVRLGDGDHRGEEVPVGTVQTETGIPVAIVRTIREPDGPATIVRASIDPWAPPLVPAIIVHHLIPNGV